MTARACSPEPPCDCSMVTVSPVLPSSRAKASLIGLVELAGRIVGDVEKGGVGKHGARREGCKERPRRRQGCCEISS